MRIERKTKQKNRNLTRANINKNWMANINRYTAWNVRTDEEKYWRLRVTSGDQGIPFGRIALVLVHSLHIYSLFYFRQFYVLQLLLYTRSSPSNRTWGERARARAERPKRKINQCNNSSCNIASREPSETNAEIRFNVKAKFPNDLQKERTKTQIFHYYLSNCIRFIRVSLASAAAAASAAELFERIHLHSFFFSFECLLWIYNFARAEYVGRPQFVMRMEKLYRHRIRFAAYDFIGNSINNKCRNRSSGQKK